MLWSARRDAALAALVALALAALVVAVVIRRSLAPVPALRDAALQVAEGKHHPQVPCTDRRDVVGELARAVETLRKTSEAAAAARATPDAERTRAAAEESARTNASVGELPAAAARIGDVVRLINAMQAATGGAVDAIRAIGGRIDQISALVSAVDQQGLRPPRSRARSRTPPPALARCRTRSAVWRTTPHARARRVPPCGAQPTALMPIPERYMARSRGCRRNCARPDGRDRFLARFVTRSGGST